MCTWLATAGDYDGTLRALVLAHKERSALGLALPLGRLLADVVGAPQPDGVVLVPVPSHPAVVRTRGHDPVLRVVRRAARVLRARGTDAGVRRLLGVVGRPQDQAGLGADERRANLAGRFHARGAGTTHVRTLLLVDDVISTGGSTELALERILPLGVVVTGVIPMVDRGDVATARFAKRGIPFHPLVSYRDLGIEPVKDV